MIGSSRVTLFAAAALALSTPALAAAPSAAASYGSARAAAGAPSLGKRQPIFPLAEVKAGMTGYGLTVFEGTRPEKFAVRVIGVLHNFLPQQDVILIRSDDARLQHTGIAAGMSGSPIYIDGKLAGALAYGWHFAKDPVAGVTPIETMLAELKRPLRGRERTPVAEAALPPLLSSAWQKPPSVDPRPATLGEPHLERVAVPLSLAGFGDKIVTELGQALAPYNVVPMQASGTARAGAQGPTRFEPGSSIAIELVRGDVSMAATGTVTYVEGDKLLAFGHPMFNVGEIYLPISTAEIHTVLSAFSSSFKLASPIHEVGSLLQDRQAGVVGDTSERANMIPVRVAVGGPRRKEHVYHAEVVRHRFLTPMLAATVIANAAQAAASDVADATVTVRSRLDLRGYQPLELVDHVYSPDGVSPRTLAAASGVKAISELLFNPFSPANLDRIDVQVDVEFKADVAEIVGVALNSDELVPGSRPSLYVTLRPYNGAEYVQTIPLDVPRSLAGQTLKVVTTAGNLSRPDVAPPENLGGLIDNLRKTYPARSIVVSLETPDEGVTLRGSVIPDLPGSVIDTLRPGASTRRADIFKRATRFIVPTHAVVQGKQEITVRVKEDALNP